MTACPRVACEKNKEEDTEPMVSVQVPEGLTSFPLDSNARNGHVAFPKSWSVWERSSGHMPVQSDVI